MKEIRFNHVSGDRRPQIKEAIMAADIIPDGKYIFNGHQREIREVICQSGETVTLVEFPIARESGQKDAFFLQSTSQNDTVIIAEKHWQDKDLRDIVDRNCIQAGCAGLGEKCILKEKKNDALRRKSRFGDGR